MHDVVGSPHHVLVGMFLCEQEIKLLHYPV